MRLGLISDVHVHRGEQFHEVAELVAHVSSQAGLDLLVFAGDASHITAETAAFLGSIRADCPRVWVPGNHDVWVIEPEHADDTAELRYTRTLRELSEHVGWHYLPAAPLDLPGWRVVGTMGWFGEPGFSEWFDAQADERDSALAMTMAAELAAQIDSAPVAARLIAVLHHIPDRRLMPPDVPRRGECNPHLWPVLRRVRDRLSLVIHGHHHRRYEQTLDGIRCVAHPFGYPRQHSGVGDGFRVIELLH
ncbi:MAG: metallophosphoesterase [Planctomycetota bacterium]